MKKVLCCFLCAILLLSMVACGNVDVSDLAGTWTGSWKEDNTLVVEILEFELSGSYTLKTYHDGALASSYEFGIYETSGNKIVLTHYKLGVPFHSEYRLRWGTLVGEGDRAGQKLKKN